MDGALSGLRILDMSSSIAGQFAARLLANLGADVILVEPPHEAPPPVSKQELARLARRRLSLNGSKRSVTVDGADQRGAGLLRMLLATTDAVIQDAPMHGSSRYFVSEAERAAAWPNLVVCTVSPLGLTGPDARRTETELTISARSSWLSSVGDPEREPLAYPGPQISYITGLQAGLAVTSALLLAEETGEGQSIDVAMLESIAMAFDQHALGAKFVPTRRQRRSGRRTLRFPPVILPTSNGFVSTLVTDNQWPRFARMCGFDDLAADPALRNHAARTARMDELESLFIPWFLERTKEEVFTIGQRFGVPITPFNSVDEVLHEPHFAAREAFLAQEIGDGRLIQTPGRPFIMSETPWRQTRPAPKAGEHNQTIFGDELGLSQVDLERLSSGGVL